MTKTLQKPKRKRIIGRTVIGIIVAKSYTNFNLKKALTEQKIYYNSLSYKVCNRSIVFKS